jgi:hypothetical protein
MGVNEAAEWHLWIKMLMWHQIIRMLFSEDVLTFRKREDVKIALDHGNRGRGTQS